MFLHTRLKVRDMARSIAFYTEHFGFELRGQKTSPRGSQLAFLKHPASPTELELAFLPWDPDFQLPEDIFHIALGVPDVWAACEALEKAGVKVTEAPSERRAGGGMAFIEDPDGYEIELLSAPPSAD